VMGGWGPWPVERGRDVKRGERASRDSEKYLNGRDELTSLRRGASKRKTAGVLNKGKHQLAEKREQEFEVPEKGGICPPFQ